MIQRIQSIYLFIALLFNSIAAAFLSGFLDKVANIVEGFNFEYHLFFGFVALLSLWTLLTFKKRGMQMKLGRLNLILNFVALGFLIYWLLILPGEIEISEKGIGFVLPIISIVFIFMAQRAIKKDDELVKSANRFR